MCNENKHQERDKLKTDVLKENDGQNAMNDTVLSNRTCSQNILLQTLYVRLRGNQEGKIVRCLIDSGSQRSYLSKRVAEEMQYDRLKEEKVIHNLFGGKEHIEKHYRHRVLVSSINKEYHCNFEVLDQEKICSKIPTLKLDPCAQELNKENIILTDQLIPKETESEDIDLLIGADVAGRYEVALPWAEDRLPLPTNKELALKRLETTTRKLCSQNLINRYDEVLKNWEDSGIIEEVKQCENIDSGHYLPHRPVIKESSSTPVRPVFDASARTKFSPSLNQCLEAGPNLIELIPSLLLRFRENKYGVVADIEKAFLQISIRPPDREYLKFFWWKNIDTKELKIFQHTKVVFGVNSSSFLLGSVLDYHFQNCMKDTEHDQKVVEKLKHSFYVDNVLSSLESEAELQNFIEESRNIMAQAKFNLRCWQYSNDKNPEVETNLLGLIWNRKTDTIKLSLTWIEDQHFDKITKRVILAVTHKVFDPVGFVSPVLLLPKLMLQDLWKSGISWDAEVDESMKEKFLHWFGDLCLLKEVSIPRWVQCHEKNKKSCSIHTFCDASGRAYAATVFLRIQTDTEVEVHLLASKSRVAPAKQITIPRLELIAATVGARLCTSVLESLQWQNVELTFWTDSTVVLSWIQKEEIWTVFVANRVHEIRKLTKPNSWKFVKGVENPADLPSRGCSAKQLLAMRWWEGPFWLKKNEDEWPQFNLVFNDEEISREKRRSAVINTQVNVESEDMFHRYSNYPRLIRFFGWIYRFYLNSKSKNSKQKANLSVQEMKNAKNAKKKKKKNPKSGVVTRPVQRVYSLEIIENDEGTLLRDKATTRKNQEPVVTRSGRIVKEPKRLGSTAD
ncbi:uncharacterized protein LOC129216408 [Uloborus diversus]|uniref:uncharacterized protein LOC129216408 n=1 Tax=Uloborus diversus TaxID=327109 RepID=UPI00240A214E|nr:uncharacterized protein LOC129216408 [Uloborus diversus]